MRVGIDIRCLVEGKRTGVEEYTINLLQNLFAIDNQNEYVLFLNSLREPACDLSWLDQYPNVSIKRFRIPNKLLNFGFWYLHWPKIDKLLGGVDIVFMPNIIFCSVSRKSKLIVTIHDLSFERYPETFSWKRRLWHLFVNPRQLARKATKVVSVSDSTKKDLISLFGLSKNEAKIATIHSGIAERFHPIDRNDGKLITIKEKYHLPYKFILFLGTLEPRKNLAAVIQAFDRLQSAAIQDKQDDLQKYHLVLIGETGWLTEEIFTEIEKAEYKEKIITIQSVPDPDKEYLFSLASLFVYPSLFEGFGFPPLEAMRCGIPAIVSNNSSLPEVVSDAALQIDPHKPEELFLAMREILTSPELYQRLREKGFKQAEGFVWGSTARKFLNLLWDVFESKKDGERN